MESLSFDMGFSQKRVHPANSDVACHPPKSKRDLLSCIQPYICIYLFFEGHEFWNPGTKRGKSTREKSLFPMRTGPKFRTGVFSLPKTMCTKGAVIRWPYMSYERTCLLLNELVANVDVSHEWVPFVLRSGRALYLFVTCDKRTDIVLAEYPGYTQEQGDQHQRNHGSTGDSWSVFLAAHEDKVDVHAMESALVVKAAEAAAFVIDREFLWRSSEARPPWGQHKLGESGIRTACITDAGIRRKKKVLRTAYAYHTHLVCNGCARCVSHTQYVRQTCHSNQKIS